MRNLNSIFIALLVLLSVASCTQVGPGNKAVTYNEWTGEYGVVFDEGFHTIAPNWDTKHYSVEPCQYTIEDGADINVRSSDGLTFSVDITIYYRLPNNDDQLRAIYKSSFRNTYESDLILPKTRSVARDVFASYDAIEVLGSKREEIGLQLSSTLSTKFSEWGIIIDGVELRNITPPKSILVKIEEKKAAQQEAEKKQYELEMAQSDAEIAKVEAQAKADVALIEAEGQANAINKINSALSSNPRYLQYLAIDKLQDNIRIIYTPDGSVNMIDVKDVE